MADTIYTDAMVTRMKELSPIDNDKALALAAEFGFSVHSVRAKAVRTEGITYQAKPKTRKDGSKVESKAEIAADIARLLETDAETVESIANATRNVLVMVRDALPEPA